MDAQPDISRVLREDFRHHLQAFYAGLNLAPPYHSVEKAITHLTATIKKLPPQARDELATNRARQWALYVEAFVDSGLSQKHRGIIAGAIKSGQVRALSQEYAAFLQTFVS